MALPSPLARSNGLLSFVLFPLDLLLFFQGTLRGDLLIFDRFLELRIEVDVVQKQIDHLYRKGRKLSLQSLPDGPSDVFPVGRNLDAFVFDGFIFEVLNDPRFDQDVEKVGADGPIKLLDGLRRNANIETCSDKDILAFFAEGVELVEHATLHLDVGKHDVAPRRHKLESLADLAFDAAKFIDDTDVAGRHLVDGGEESDKDHEGKDQGASRFQQTGEEKYLGSPVVTGLWESPLGCEKERSDHRKDGHPDDIRHRLFLPRVELFDRHPR